jgi:DNA-binding MarR family transcriptional regulator
MSRSGPSTLLFNPREATTAALADTLVGRDGALRTLVDGIDADRAGPTRRHWLVVGPRGVGKSHLTELVSRRLAERGWRVARLPEEHYRAHSVGRLAEEILAACGGGRPFASVRDDEVLFERAAAEIRRVSAERPLVVVLENLQMLLERRVRATRDHARLRAWLQHDPPFVLLASTPSHLDALSDHARPFFDYFQTLTLADLDQDAVVELVRRRAVRELDPDDPLRADFLVEVARRVRAIHHLTGGNPRLALLLYAGLSGGGVGTAADLLTRLLDEVTPTYRARLQEVSPQQELLLVELALSPVNITPAELGHRCRLPTNQVTAHLTKLRDEGMVSTGDRVDGRRRYVEVPERLFRLWIQIRERPGDPLPGYLAEFFERWYADAPVWAGRDSGRWTERVAPPLRDAALAVLDASDRGRALDALHPEVREAVERILERSWAPGPSFRYSLDSSASAGSSLAADSSVEAWDAASKARTDR